MFVLLFGLTLRAAKAAAAIVVLAMVAYSHHAAEDRTRFAELVTLAEIEPIREPMSLRPGADRMRLSELLTAADQEQQTRLRTPAISVHPRETFRQDNADRAKSSCKVNQSYRFPGEHRRERCLTA